MSLPGGSFFADITRLFDEAGRELNDGELILADGFTLNEAMSAIEIGDPRMDSGAPVPGEESRPEFNPFVPLLPEEVCWILDRALACEMHWHAGYSLSQTVFTCLYVHHLNRIISDAHILRYAEEPFDEAHPVKLVSLVLRAGITGMLKSCELAYRELAKGNVHEGEDWLGEKSDVPMCEGLQPYTVIALIEEAEQYVIHHGAAWSSTRDRLLERLAFRKSILHLLTSEEPLYKSLPPLLSTSRRLFSLIKSHPNAAPLSSSRALASFDTRVARQLHSVMPVRPLESLSESEACVAVDGFLAGWEDIAQLAACEDVLAWVGLSNLQASTPFFGPRRVPFLRSLAQTVFSTGTVIFGKYSYQWLIDHFFFEVTDVPFSRIQAIFDRNWLNSSPTEDFQRSLAKLLMQHVWAAFHNRPRQRRHLMRTNLDWHALSMHAVSLISRAKPKEANDSETLPLMLYTILHWRGDVIRDIVLSGFELELYSEDERPFAYWFIARVLEVQGKVREAWGERAGRGRDGSSARAYVAARNIYSLALREIFTTCFLLLCKKSTFDTKRRWMNFVVRYKWALPEMQNASTCLSSNTSTSSSTSTNASPFSSDMTSTSNTSKATNGISTNGTNNSTVSDDPFQPDFEAYLRGERGVLKQDKETRLHQSIRLLEDAQKHLAELDVQLELARDPSLKLCKEEFRERFLITLINQVNNLKNALAGPSGLLFVGDSKRFSWRIGGEGGGSGGSPWVPYIEILSMDTEMGESQ